MERKKSRDLVIKKWIQENQNSEKIASSGSLREDPRHFRNSVHVVRKDDTNETRAKSLHSRLSAYFNANFYGVDWQVRINVTDTEDAFLVKVVANQLEVDFCKRKLEETKTSTNTISLPDEDFLKLINFEMDLISILVKNKQIGEENKPFIRPFSDLFFGAYNLYHLHTDFAETLIQEIYHTGKVKNLRGDQRFVFPWAITSDIGSSLYELVLKSGSRNSLEIGLAFGLSALFICQAHVKKRFGQHTAIDPCQSVEFQSIGVDQIKKAGQDAIFRHLESKDYEILPNLLSQREKFDFIFIDGLHMHDYVVIDYFYSDLLLEVGGILAFDDCQTPGVSSAVAFLENNRDYVFEEQYSDHRLRVYKKISEDSRTIVNPNHHVDYFQKSKALLLDATEVSAVSSNEAVAIIGIDGVFPQDLDVDEFWKAIADERTLYDNYSTDYLYDRRDRTRGERFITAGLLGSAFAFDPDFFGISHREAELMDPQLRHLLMSVYRCLEDAGYTRQQLEKKVVGVFVGSEGSEYNEMHRASAIENGYLLNHSGSTIANRISYYFDFRGPSEVVNTMCSSGAFCVHRAVEALRRGEIEYAVVAAVKINFSAKAFESLADLKITSSGQACHSFHNHSDGYIRSEGVVSLFLGLRSKAKSHHDHVYANIRQVATNYNGRDGNSMFSPSINGQKEVMLRCFDSANIDMSEIAFLEAQGMGNEISDLVEFSAINEAFRVKSCEEKPPVISTLKPILGHMECVSSLGALLKIIFSFRTRMLYKIPRLGKEDINSKLDYAQAPCKLLVENNMNFSGQTMRASLNSFGASGSNVHILLEENIESETHKEPPEIRDEKLLILSAKTRSALHGSISKLLDYLNDNAASISLYNLCQTWQLRRNHYQERVIFYLPSADEQFQIEQLKELLSCYLGNVQANSAVIDNCETGLYSLCAQTHTGRRSELLQQGMGWLAGKEIDWIQYQHHGMQKGSERIPGYCFDLQEFKLQSAALDPAISGRQNTLNSARWLHPILHRNTSTIDELCYTSNFSGDEFFLDDHQVHGQKILPAVVYLEIARAALNNAFKITQKNLAVRISNVVWATPIAGKSNEHVSIAMYTREGQRGQHDILDFQIYADFPGASEQLVNCQGMVATVATQDVTKVNLDQLKATFSCVEDAPAKLYSLFANIGIHYGAAHRCIQQIFVGDNELLVQLKLPEKLVNTLEDYTVHPALADGALQASAWLESDFGEGVAGLYLPFALDEIIIIHPCESIMYAHLKKCGAKTAVNGNLKAGSQKNETLKLDVELMNSEGQICSVFKGFTARAVSSGEAIAYEKQPETGVESHKLIVRDGTESVVNRDLALDYFKKVFAEVIKRSPGSIHPNKAFADYGLDSVLVVNLVNRIRPQFGDLPATLFFEVNTLAGLVDYLQIHRPLQLSALVGHDLNPEKPVKQDAINTSKGKIVEFDRKIRRSRNISKTQDNSQRSALDIAVIGLAGRYPGARNLDEFWSNLEQGKNCITEIPEDRWNWKDYTSKIHGITSKWGGFISDIDKFDPLFFKIAPLEAERMDPQERVFLEACYHAIEDAGYIPETLAENNKVGVFVGVMNSYYSVAPDHFSYANRVSYNFNFYGPSIALDTACSSSLTSIHFAMEAITNGSCECALAGGVNLIVDPLHYLRLSETGGMSTGNQCKSFGAEADGFIDAEGVGVVVLKLLEHAERDRDRIYAVLKGSSVNAGGRTHGYTVPNPLAQAQLITDAFRRSGITAADVSYIEAHGTGTPLGDPIEISGLSKAFGVNSEASGYCAIGSVKSNIGHCEAAAGIAGLTKVLLQLKYRKLVPSLHAEKINNEIDFSRTPFKLNSKLTDWIAPIRNQNGITLTLPRIAGISSFGMGGANAHVLVEEYCKNDGDQDLQLTALQLHTLIPLSARTGDQLLCKVKDLYDFISTERKLDELVQDSLAYTLQTGREQMQHRMIFVVQSIEELQAKLATVKRGTSEQPGVFSGQANDSKVTNALFDNEKDIFKLASGWLGEGKPTKLAELWAQGVSINWKYLYQGTAPRKLSLPGYPFARQSFWNPGAGYRAKTSTVTRTAKGSSHPLLHENLSDFFAQRYRTTLNGEEFFVQGHKVQGHSILSAVCQLELVTAAIKHAGYLSDDLSSPLEITNVVWERPIVIDHELSLMTELTFNQSRQLSFKIFASEDQDLEYSQGLIAPGGIETATIADKNRLAKEIPAQELDVEQLYSELGNVNIIIDKSYRCIKKIYRNSDQVLVFLELPEALVNGGYTLHPALIDSALHASFAFGLHTGKQLEAAVPWSMDSLTLLSASSDQMVACIHPVSRKEADGRFTTVDVEFFNSAGDLSLIIKGLRSRTAKMSRSHERRTGLLMAYWYWKEKSVDPDHPRLPGETERIVVDCTQGNGDRSRFSHETILVEPKDNLAQSYSALAVRCFTLIKEKLSAKQHKKPLYVQLLIEDRPENFPFAGLAGLFKTATLENPRFQGQILFLPSGFTYEQTLTLLEENSQQPDDVMVRYAKGKRYVQAWREHQPDAQENTPDQLVKNRGVYLVVGGLGKLGSIFARDLLTKAKDTRIILTGRMLPANIDDILKARFGEYFARISYRQVDLSEESEVVSLAAWVNETFGHLNGILHIAGAVADNYILKKTTTEFEQVLNPKVQGTCNLDEAFKDFKLDFFALFSSASAIAGNAGQADYACANAFMDAFACYRNGLVASGIRDGKTLSLNWPYWQDGGMQLIEENVLQLRNSLGMLPLQTEKGLASFYRAFHTDYGQFLIAEGELDKLRGVFLEERTRQAYKQNLHHDPANDNLPRAAERYLIDLCAEIFKLDKNEIDADQPLENYGIDSILAIKLTNKLETVFGSLSKTLFFEYQTLGQLAVYFWETFPETLAQAVQSGSDRVIKDRPVKNLVKRTASHVAAGVNAHGKITVATPPAISDIAIIGVAGRYPQADTLDEFWDNLKSGRDCITEIPFARWDYSLHFSEQNNDAQRAYSKWGGFLEDVDKFDPLFFNISPKEAALIDPQERLFLETVWRTVEDAGYNKKSIQALKDVGVYVGVMWGHYELLGAETAVNPEKLVPSSSFASIANRVSYYFNFQGPSMAVDTMCSSSITAIHLACEALQNQSIQVAIAGGVNISAHPNKYLNLAQGNFASSDGRCRSFGEGGDGYVPGEGVGAVLLKPLAAALADRDHIYAVIKSTTINHGGKTNGYTVPNPHAQAELLSSALAKAKIAPATITYIEAHGTGTALGDPIEVSALTKAFSVSTASGNTRCAIGSVKSNIGHLESAAGIAALTKVLLQFKYGQLVPSLHCSSLNPNINFDGTPFTVQRELSSWETDDKQIRRAGVSSFGAGGANAHLILEEHVVNPESEQTGTVEPCVFVLSAKSHSVLTKYVGSIRDFLETYNGNLQNLAYTSQFGRTAMEERLAVCAESLNSLKLKLKAWLEQQNQPEQSSDSIVDSGICQGNIKDKSLEVKTWFDGTAGSTYIDVLTQTRDIEKLARLWVSGIEIDWSVLYDSRQPLRVPFPGYPFERISCWYQLKGSERGNLDSVSSQVNSVHTNGAHVKTTTLAPRLIHGSEQWQLSNLKPGLSRLWIDDTTTLLVNPWPGFCEALGNVASQRGGRSKLLALNSGNECRYCEAGEYELDLQDAEHLSWLFTQLHAGNSFPERIVWCFENPAAGSSGNLQDIFKTWLIFAKSLFGQRVRGSIKILALVPSAEAQCTMHIAAMSGFFKTLTLEDSRLQSKLIYLGDFPVSSENFNEYAHICIDELQQDQWKSGEYCYTKTADGSKPTHLRQIRNLIFDTVGKREEIKTLPIKNGGTYVISGGLGGLGFIFANYLVEKYNAGLILLGRSDLNSEKSALLAALRKKQANVHYATIDICDLNGLKNVLREYEVRAGHINGVIHTAGRVKDSLIINKDYASAKQVLDPKIQGVMNLDLATQHLNIDLFVVFSSLAGVIGNPGQVDYAYANRFLDKFSRWRQELADQGQRHGKTLTISWPLWAEGGMSSPHNDIKNSGFIPLPTGQGIAYFEYCLQSQVNHAIAFYGNSELISKHFADRVLESTESRSEVKLDNPLILRNMLKAYLAEIIAHEIQLAAVQFDTAQAFDYYGIDSVIIGRVAAKMDTDLGSLPKTLMYEYTSVDDLTGYLFDHETEKVAKYFTDKITIHSTATGDQPDKSFVAQLPARTRQTEILDLAAANKIAIVGVHARFPEANSMDEFWDNLAQGRSSIKTVPASRWDSESLYDADPERAFEGKTYCKWGGFLDGVDEFDAEFFGISSIEAKAIDPQERLFLESVWAAIEDAGYTRESLKQFFPKNKSADVGVFCGVTTNTYNLLVADNSSEKIIPGALPWSIANRVSYFFDFKGPSFPVDTACSSSLVAVHLACESLRRRECQIAIAGGVNLYLHPSKYQSFCQRKMVSRSGVNFSYGYGDDGFVPGEAVGSLVLKPLELAIAHKDHIYGVISGSAFDHSGRSNGYSAPNPGAQASLIEKTLALAGIQADSISYVEGHGTGTQLGDSLEVSALTSAFNKQTEKLQYCALGSVKSNIGHAESAAGIAGMLKVLLQFKHKQVAPTLNVEVVNPNIDFERTPFYLATEPGDWAVDGQQTRRALVNSFGAGGVNACVVMEEFVSLPESDPGATAEDQYLIVLSARSQSRLAAYAQNLHQYLVANPQIILTDLAYTLQTGREAMSERVAFVVSEYKELLLKLAKYLVNDTENICYLKNQNPDLAVATKAAGRIAETAISWVNGGKANWESLYNNVPRKISLPHYPFARNRYWINASPGKKDTSETAVRLTRKLHPLVSFNASTLQAIRFTSLLSNADWYARDHVVNGQSMLPGSAFLEIACFTGMLAGEHKVRSIRDIIWMHPLVFSGYAKNIQTVLKAIGDATEFEIFSSNEVGEQVKHVEGRVFYNDSDFGHINLESIALSGWLNGDFIVHKSADDFYRDTSAYGIHYEDGFRVVREYFSRENCALAKISLPDSLLADFDEYLLHPALVDGALQAVAGLLGVTDKQKVFLPFALDELRICGALSSNCFAYAELVKEDGKSAADVRKFNIAITNESGLILIKMTNFYAKVVALNTLESVSLDGAII